jgi:hypothetical protein
VDSLQVYLLCRRGKDGLKNFDQFASRTPASEPPLDLR